MKRKAIVIDDDDDDGCRRLMVNAISGHTSAKSERIDVPIICLDEDYNDDLMIDKDYRVFLDHLRDGSNLTRGFEVDNGESDTRKFKIFSCEPKLENENHMKNRVYQQRMKKSQGCKAERVNIREIIQRDNRAVERRKRRNAELVTAGTSRAFPSLKTELDIQQRDNTVSKGRKRNADELKAETLRKAVPLVSTEEGIQRDNRAAERRKRRNAAEFVPAMTSRSVPVLKTQLDIQQRDNTVSEGRKRKADELKAEILRKAVPLVSAEEGIQRDNSISDPRERKNAETKAAETSRVVHVERVTRVTELKDVDVTSRTKQVFVGRKKKKEKESEPLVDKDYMRYLTWLVDSLRDSTTNPMANLHIDPSDLDTLKESTVVPEMDPLVKVKIEQDLDSWSDGSDIIEINDTPFLDGEGTPFVASKKVVDLESEEDDRSSCWFTKKLMAELEKPYDEGELKERHHEASVHKKMTRCRELRKGRETDYETDKMGQSYLESFPDFEKKYKLVDGVDKERALKLLRGFFLYVKYVSRDGVFKPWEKNQWS